MIYAKSVPVSGPGGAAAFIYKYQWDDLFRRALHRGRTLPQGKTCLWGCGCFCPAMP